MTDSKITALTEDPAPSLTDLLVTVKDPGGTPLSRKVQITNVLKLLQGNIVYLTNNDGVAHYAGTVVIFDTSIDNGCKKTTSAGDPRVCGVAAETVSAGASGKYYQMGQATVLVQGNVSRGMWVTASSTSGRAQASTYTKPTSGGIGIALTSYAGGGAGSVTVMIQVQLTSTAPLQQLATTSTNTGTGATLTTAHTTDLGTDLLIVRILSTTAIPTSVTYNGTGMTIIDSINNGTLYCSSYYLRTPSVGSYNLVVNFAGSYGACVIATNYAGSLVSPLRAASKTNGGGVTSISLTPASAVGDIVLDNLAVTLTGWSVTAGQTSEGQRTSGAGQFQSSSYKAGAAGSTTMSWSGASSTNVAFMAFAIAGS
jgi:hypothetical protein